MVVVPQSFRDMPRWWADAAGREWLDRLPKLVEAFATRWRLDIDGPPWHGSNALVVPVARGAERLALRLAPPGDDVAAEVAALRFWRGHGTVGCLDADVTERVMLLERLDGSRALTGMPLRPAVAQLARLVVALAVSAPDDAPTTQAIAAAELRRFVDVSAMPNPHPLAAAHLGAAKECAAALAADAPGPLAVDGDLHFDQVLLGPRGWTVVDPVLLRGDPEYDLGRVLWSRLDEVDDDGELRRLFELFVSIAAVPLERARRWVVVRSMSYLLWGLEHGLTQDPPRCRRLLDVFG